MPDSAQPTLDPGAFAAWLAEHDMPLLDLRPTALFARGHLPGALNFPYSPTQFVDQLRDALQPGPVALIDDIPALTQRALADLASSGWSVAAVLAGGTLGWQQDGRPLQSLPQIAPDDLQRVLQAPQPPRVLDLREDYEYRYGTIDGTEHLPLGRLPQAVRDLPKDQEYVLVCASGARSAAAQAYMHRHGFKRVHNLAGGIGMWQATGKPVVRP